MLIKKIKSIFNKVLNNTDELEIHTAKINKDINNDNLIIDLENKLSLLHQSFKIELETLMKTIGYSIKNTGNENIVLQGINNSTVTINQLPNDTLLELIPMVKQLIEAKGEKNQKILRYRVPAKPEFFIGRKDILTNLHNKLTQKEIRSNITLISGIGGLGKTTLAQEYVNSEICQLYFQRIIYISIQSEIENTFINAIATAFNIDLKKHPNTNERAEIIQNVLQNCEGENLVFIDNANDKNQLDSCKSLFKSTGWKFLITTRSQPDSYKGFILYVNELDIEDAILLFKYHYIPNVNTPELLKSLLEKVNRHTLLIELLAKVGEKKGYSVKKLLEILEEQDRLMKSLNKNELERNIYVGQHAVSTGAFEYSTIHNYIQCLFEPEKLNLEHITIARFFSVLPADDIPIEHLKILWRINVEKENVFEEQLDYLKQWGWLSSKYKINNEFSEQKLTFKMHPLVQEVVYDKLPPNINNIRPLILTVNEIIGKSFVQYSEYQFYAKSIIDKLNFLNDLKK